MVVSVAGRIRHINSAAKTVHVHQEVRCLYVYRGLHGCCLPDPMLTQNQTPDTTSGSNNSEHVRTIPFVMPSKPARCSELLIVRTIKTSLDPCARLCMPCQT
eukprot:TRINITY_DN65727_c0_g1_i1.p2 TRINITY_DN65727_c0_g1~~TRINITY_DN65727_c0_g1_i1.p2  ORF type:complete len:102 (-),score=0.63 TRINITY_DN65727_c0_g1_i1:198-503(-)